MQTPSKQAKAALRRLNRILNKIRKTERAWLKLGDAWIAFGRLAYPGLDSTRIAAEFTRVRLKQLEEETHVP
jgi:hypothetical protein